MHNWSSLATTILAMALVTACATGTAHVDNDSSPSDSGSTDTGAQTDSEATNCDHDGDGYCAEASGSMPGGDCCDQAGDPGCVVGFTPDEIHPGAAETCADQGADNDCDGDSQEVDDLGGSCTLATVCPDTLCPCRFGELACVNDELRCEQVTYPTSEACDGYDDDCDNLDDFLDFDAQDACTDPNQYCGGQVCVGGCNGPADCMNGNTCNTATHQCECGGGPPCTGNFSCDGTGSCLCDGVSCGPGEECAGGGLCQCGTTGPTGAGGEACVDTTDVPDCNPGANRCDCDGFLCGTGETCSGPGGHCACGTNTAPLGGEACPGADECCTDTCVDLVTSVDNCQSCGNDCDGDPADDEDNRGNGCNAFGCRCDGGAACAGTHGDTCCPGSGCVDLEYDEDNCGSCGNQCALGVNCSCGACGGGACS